MSQHPSPHARRRLVLSALATALVFGSPVMGPATAADGPPARFKEVGLLPLLGGPEVGDDAVDRSGWLILNPSSRRGYQVFETPSPEGALTVVQSFDLDTLQPRRRAVLLGAPITSGVADVSNVSTTSTAGEVVHAVDRARGRIHLALSRPQALDQVPGLLVGSIGFPPDGQRPLDRFVTIDEAAFDRGDAGYATSFGLQPELVRLQAYWLVGMTVTPAGGLLALFAQPQPGGAANPIAFFDHTLARVDTGAPGWARRLETCRSAPLASAGGFLQGSYQWGLLVTSAAVYTACHAAPGNGAVVRLSLENGAPLLVGGETIHPLGQRISDVLVDEGNQRLLVRSFGGGTVLWRFDTASNAFAGGVLVKGTDSYSVALGVQPETGRLYALVEDHTVFEGGVAVPVQGGLQYSDPPAALTNVVPGLAYPANFRIQVDPVTKRFFVRRGHPAFRATLEYPGTQADTAAPVEPFYRVFEDKAR